MSIKVEKKENSVVSFKLEIGAEAFEAAMEKSYRKNVKQFNIPGFRKGKAPRKMIEKMYSPAVFYDDAINFAFPDEYDKAINELGLEPVDRPEVDIDTWPEEGKNLVLTVNVTVKPEVKLSKFDKVLVEVPKYPVAKKDVDEELNRMREQNSRLVTVEDRKTKDGDTITFDFDGSVDGVPFDGGKAENYTLVLGSGQFIPGFEDQLIYKAIEEDVEVNVTFPEEYMEKSLSGKAAVFKCKIHTIQVKELPELDDDFAKDTSEFDTLKELRDDVTKKLKNRAEAKVKEELENKAIEFVVSKMKAEIPSVMVETRIDDMVRDFEMKLSYQGLKLDKYLEYAGITMEALRAQMKDQAEAQVKGVLAIDAVAKRDGITASDEEVEAEFTKMAEQYKMEVSQIKQYIQFEDLRKDVVTNKTVEAIIAMVEDTPAKKPAAKKATDETAEKKPAAKKATTTKKAADTAEKKPAAKKTAATTAKKAPAKKTAAKKTEE